jgi:hydantoinase/carbamoylase family amidase
VNAGLAFGPALMARLDELATFSDEDGRLTRLYLSPAHRRAMRQVAAWMAEAGMAARLDPVGNVIGRYEGLRPGAPAILIGSHIDTVIDAGRYDGALGVLAGIAAVGALDRAGERLPVALEVVAFGDEEGVRFPTTLTGSRALAGTFDPGALDARDSEGVSLRAALAAAGCDGDAFDGCARRPEDTVAYLEVHIEQGPVLEAEGLPLGVVSAINGATRWRVEVNGVAGHAGTVPMALRRDALAAAAEMVLAVEREGRAMEDLVATVGQLEVWPGAVNVVPGGVRFSIDVRAPSNAVREAALAVLEATFTSIAERRGAALAIERFHDAGAVSCDPALIEQLSAAVGRAGLAPRLLPSGAGHDAMALAALCPIGMLFVRCAGGISHHPAEAISVADADLAVRVLLDAVRHTARDLVTS